MISPKRQEKVFPLGARDVGKPGGVNNEALLPLPHPPRRPSIPLAALQTMSHLSALSHGAAVGSRDETGMVMEMTLTRDDATGLYTFEQNGMKVAYPSVSNIVRPLVDTHVAEYHLNKGRLVHRATQILDANEGGGLDWESLDPALRPYVEAYADFKCAFGGITFTMIEEPLLCHKLRFAGRIDRLGNGIIMDIKCGGIRPEYGVRLAGYALLVVARFVGENPNPIRQTIHLFPDGKWKLKTWKDISDKKVFLSLLEVENWRIRNA